MGSASIEAGDVFDIDVSLANPGNPVAGIQVQIQDIPDHLDVNNIVGTDDEELILNYVIASYELHTLYLN